jgi:hypothetical protein
MKKLNKESGTKEEKEDDASWVIEQSPDAVGNVAKFIQASDWIVEACGDAPTTVSEYIQKMQEAVKAPKAPHLSPATTVYMLGWHIRTHMLCMMHEKNIRTLKADSQSSVNAFTHMNPDACEWLIKLRSHFQFVEGHVNDHQLTLSKFISLLGARQKPHLVSMWLCFAGDRGFRQSDFDETFKVAEWRAAADKYRAETGVSPHPVAPASVKSSLSFCSVYCIGHQFIHTVVSLYFPVLLLRAYAVFYATRYGSGRGPCCPGCQAGVLVDPAGWVPLLDRRNTVPGRVVLMYINLTHAMQVRTSGHVGW